MTLTIRPSRKVMYDNRVYPLCHLHVPDRRLDTSLARLQRYLQHSHWSYAHAHSSVHPSPVQLQRRHYSHQPVLTIRKATYPIVS